MRSVLLLNNLQWNVMAESSRPTVKILIKLKDLEDLNKMFEEAINFE